MFRITFMCEDKHLGPVLRAVTGMAISMEPPQPVVNAEVSKSGKVTSTSMGDVLSLVLKELEARGNMPFNRDVVLEIRQKLGLSAKMQAAHSNIYNLVQKGHIVRIGRNNYQLTKET